MTSLALCALLVIVIVIVIAILIARCRTTFVGGDDRPMLVFISGLGNGRESFNWNDASDELVNKMRIARNSGIENPLRDTFDTFSFDPPSVGDNREPVPNTIEEYCDWIHGKVRADVILVAHSLGCVVANKYTEMYPVVGAVYLDPTPDFILEEMRKPTYYTKSGGKYDITKKYIDLMSRDETHPNRDALVIFNIDDGDARGDEYRDYIARNYPNAKLVRNKTHFIHLVDPSFVIDAIRDYALARQK